MPSCPAGHQTTQSDFCDTCGLPVTATQEAAVASAAPVVAAPVVCPHCRTPNVADALFCEACGFDFTSGVVPEPATAPGDPVPTPGDPVPTPADPATTPAEPPTSPAEPVEAPASPAVEWVAELWIDPDWYAAQGSTDPLPSPGLPDIAPLVKESNLVGRVSHSRGIFPDVDCELDAGCSRRHAMLTTDGTRWWVEDLDSANGTFVGAAAGPLPGMPIPRGRVELAPGQRIYVGAWTRIVVRRATEDEQEAFAS